MGPGLAAAAQLGAGAPGISIFPLLCFEVTYSQRARQLVTCGVAAALYSGCCGRLIPVACAVVGCQPLPMHGTATTHSTCTCHSLLPQEAVAVALAAAAAYAANVLLRYRPLPASPGAPWLSVALYIASLLVAAVSARLLARGAFQESMYVARQRAEADLGDPDSHFRDVHGIQVHLKAKRGALNPAAGKVRFQPGLSALCNTMMRLFGLLVLYTLLLRALHPLWLASFRRLLCMCLVAPYIHVVSTHRERRSARWPATTALAPTLGPGATCSSDWQTDWRAW